MEPKTQAFACIVSFESKFFSCVMLDMMPKSRVILLHTLVVGLMYDTWC